MDDLVGAYVGDYTFDIKGKKIQMTMKEVGEILGLSNKGFSVVMKPKAKPIYYILD